MPRYNGYNWPTEARARQEFEAREVWPSTKLKAAMDRTGYDAYRVSPRTTKRYGKTYRAVYGATISPKWDRRTGKDTGYKVEWYPHGYTTAAARSGSKMIQQWATIPAKFRKDVKRQLMMR